MDFAAGPNLMKTSNLLIQNSAVQNLRLRSFRQVFRRKVSRKAIDLDVTAEISIGSIHYEVYSKHGDA